MTVSEVLADFISKTEFSGIPPEVIRNAKRCVLDTIGCTLRGARSRWADVLTDYLLQTGGVKQAHVIGLSLVTSAPMAAFANGVLSHVDDLDDLFYRIGHPSIVVLPAALALAEMEQRSGREFLAAFVLGWEVECHLGTFFNPWHIKKGWYPTSTIGIFGATVAGSKLVELDPERTCWAIGIAACQSAGLRASFGTMTREFQVGKVGLNGVMAALMAKSGVNAARDVFEGHAGFLGAYTACDNPEAIQSGLGDPWKMFEPGVRFKRYPSCSCTHSGIEAALKLKEEHQFVPDEIARVNVLTDPLAPDILSFPRPKDVLEAKFSMPFCIALAIVEGDVTVANFTDNNVHNPALISLMEQIILEIAPELKQEAHISCGIDTTVVVTLKDGRVYSRRVKIPHGHPERPFSDEEVEEKFLQCTEGILSEKAAYNCVEIIRHLEDLSSMSELGALLSCTR